MTSPPDMHRAARELAERVGRVMVLHEPRPGKEGAGACSCKRPTCGKSAGKHPRLKEWQRHATRDPQVIAAWWGKWPAANVGIAMGGDERLVAIDVDGAEGRATLVELEAAHGPLPTTLTALSGREDGGEHRIFRVPDELELEAIPNGVGRARGSRHPGIDVRATGGQIAAPPSLHYTGRRYAWATDEGPAHAVAELPRWLYDIITAEPERAERPAPELAPSGPSEWPLETRRKRAEAWLRKAEPAVDGQHGGTQTFTVAMTLARGFELGESETLSLMLSSGWNASCQPPWTERDLARKVREAATKGSMAWGEKLGPPPAPKPRRKPPKAPQGPPQTSAATQAAPKLDEDTPEAAQAAKGGRVVAFPGGHDASWEDLLMTTQKGGVKRALHNIVTCLELHPAWAEKLRRNDFTEVAELGSPGPWGGEAGEWGEADDVRLVLWLEREIGVTFAAGMCRDAVNLVAARKSYHPVRDWLRGLRWDGQVRLDTWLGRYLGAAASEAYLGKVGPWWLVSAVARVMRPGCQADHVLVLEGSQGVGKSTAIRTLGGDWYGTISSDLGSKDSFVELRSKWILEIDELAAMRRSDVERVKSYVSRTADNYRAPYARGATTVHRQCVFAGTTNEEAWMGDATGGRRWWPVRCGEVAHKALTRDRELLWAEAVARYDSGERWHPLPEDREELAAEVDARVQVDPWEEPVAAYLASRMAEVTVSDVLDAALKKERRDWTRADEMRVGQILRRCGWTRIRRGGRGTRTYVYVRDGALPAADQGRAPIPQ